MFRRWNRRNLTINRWRDKGMNDKRRGIFKDQSKRSNAWLIAILMQEDRKWRRGNHPIMNIRKFLRTGEHTFQINKSLCCVLSPSIVSDSWWPFPGGSDGKVSVCLQCGRPKFNPWVRKISWRRKWQPAPVFLPGESQGQRSLVGYSPCGCKELDTTEWLSLQYMQTYY